MINRNATINRNTTTMGNAIHFLRFCHFVVTKERRRNGASDMSRTQRTVCMLRMTGKPANAMGTSYISVTGIVTRRVEVRDISMLVLIAMRFALV